jgi:hypothetical protein
MVRSNARSLDDELSPLLICRSRSPFLTTCLAEEYSLMPRTCRKCGAKTTVPSFQFWNGRCSDCQSAITIGAWCSDASCPIPTKDEIDDYHRYMDDLNAMRWRRLADSRFGFVFGIAHVFLFVGVFVRWIQPVFGVIFWVSVAIASIIAVKRDARNTCPRCGLHFDYKKVFGIRTRPGRTRRAGSYKCTNCGLRALSQADFRRAAVDATASSNPDG